MQDAARAMTELYEPVHAATARLIGAAAAALWRVLGAVARQRLAVPLRPRAATVVDSVISPVLNGVGVVCPA